MRTLLLSLLLAGIAHATSAYLRTPGTNYCNITAATNATPIAITVDNASACGLSNGATIVVADVCGNTAANINANTNQLARIVSSLSGNTFNLLDLASANVAGNGSYAACVGNGEGRLGLATAYTLKSPPLVWLDGSGGTLTTAQSDTSGTGRANTNNPAYNALVTASGNFTTNYGAHWGADAAGTNQVPGSGGENAGLYWLATGNSTAETAAVWDLQNPDQYVIPTCDETQRQCNQASGNYRWDYGSLQAPQFAQLYSLLESQLTTGQKQFFLALFLNDKRYDAGGFDTSNAYTAMSFTTVACVGSCTTGISTLTQNSTAVVGTGSPFSGYSAGDYLIFPTGGYPIYTKIATVNNANSVTLTYPWVSSTCSSTSACTSAFGSSDSNSIQYIHAPVFTTSNLGFPWYVKHAEFSILCGGNSTICQTNYPTTGGQGGSGTWNLSVTQLTAEISLGVAMCGDDPRACNMLEQAEEYWYDLSYAYDLSGWTGENQSGYNYSMDRTGWMYGTIIQALKNSFVSGPDLVTSIGNVYSHTPSRYLYADMPGGNSGTFGTVDPFGEIAGPGYWDVLHMQSWPIEWYLNRGSTEAAYDNYWMQNDSGYYTAGKIGGGGGGWVPFFYTFFDPAGTATNISGAPTAYAFNQTDEAKCVTIFGSDSRCSGLAGNLPATPSQLGFWWAVSKTGFTAADTRLTMDAQSNSYYFDHSGYFVGNVFELFREVPLMTGDNSTYAAAWGPGYGGGNGAYGGNGYLELGGADNRYNTYPNYATVYIPRWTDGANEGAQNKFAYSVTDATGAYVSGVSATRVQTHFAHLKKSATPDYIVEYRDTAVGTAEEIRGYYDLTFQPGGACGTTTTNSCITANLATGTFANLQSGQAVLNIKVFPVAGSNSIFISNANASNTNGSYTSQNGYAWQYWVCASTSGSSCNTSATSGEWLAVYQPSTTTTTTMPTLTQPAVSATGGNATAVQIADADGPKVAVFARQGATLTAASFTTTHSSTAQYLVAGMTPGTYAVTVGGTPVTGSPFTVVAGDNTMYWESGSGAVSIGAQAGIGGMLTNGVTLKNVYAQ